MEISGTVKRHVGELVIELGQVQAPLDLRIPRRRHLALHELVPAQLAEKFLRLDVVGVVGARAEASLGVLGQQAPQEQLGAGGEVVGVVQRAPADLLEELLPVAAVEGGQAREHLVEEGAQGPPVHGAAVALAVEDLGGEVLRRAAEAVGAAGGIRDALLGEAKVREPDVAAGIQQDVLGLQIAVDDVEVVHVVDGQRDFGGVEARPGFGELPDLAQVEKQLKRGVSDESPVLLATSADAGDAHLPAGTVIENEVQLVRRLKGHVQSHDERVLDVAQDGAFRSGVFYLIALDDVVLLEYLQGKHFAAAFLSHEEHLACFAGKKSGKREEGTSYNTSGQNKVGSISGSCPRSLLERRLDVTKHPGGCHLGADIDCQGT